jgi:hypothetical protein
LTLRSWMLRALRAEHRVRLAEKRVVEAERQRDLTADLAARAMTRLSDDDLIGLRAEIDTVEDD